MSADHDDVASLVVLSIAYIVAGHLWIKIESSHCEEQFASEHPQEASKSPSGIAEIR